MNIKEKIGFIGLLVFCVLVIFGLFWNLRNRGIYNPNAAVLAVNPAINHNESVGRGSAGRLPENTGRKTVNFLFVGDIMLDRNVKSKIDQFGVPYLFSRLASSTRPDGEGFFQGYDIVSANLEGAVTDNGAHYPPVFSYDFAFAPDNVAALKQCGFNFFNIANNHLADQGNRGIIETRKNLDKLGFFYAGCRDQEVDECSSTVIDRNGFRIGMVGLSMVYGRFDETEAEKLISGLATTTNMVVVNIHWGTEYQHLFGQTQQRVAHDLIDAGADMIIGSHPHVVEGMEIYHNRPIFYSLGNFIFDQYFSTDTQAELAVGITADDNLFKVSLYPLASHQSQPELMTGNAKADFLKEFVGWSPLDDETKGKVETGEFSIQ